MDTTTEALAQRKAAWAHIQDTCPEMAGVMQNMRRAFGKPQRVRIKIGGELIIDSRPTIQREKPNGQN